MQQQQCGHPDATIGCLSEPVNLGGITLANRIAVSPMCQYSAEDGAANDWHLQHVASLSLAGAALVIVKQTAAEPAGRIGHGCLGLHCDANERALARVVGFFRRAGRGRAWDSRSDCRVTTLQLSHERRHSVLCRRARSGGLITLDM
jgi:2,4-dienoyl-CoA reductase-like NADH-dependent reductase (Old Yellow Enzyme family)